MSGREGRKVKEETRRRSSRSVKEEEIRTHLEGFREKALALGASAAEVIPTSHVVVEERVWMKCLVPRCAALRDGGSPYCPPHTPHPDFMRKVFSQYDWAILFKTDVEPLEDYIPTSEVRAKELLSKRGQTQEGRGFHEKTWEILGQLESYVQSKRYDLAMGFGAGSCKHSLCHGAPCGVFQNGNCRFPFRARPSMEAVGIDVFDLANKVGWEIYMIRSVEPDLSIIPCAISVGIVLVG
jgi:predicted metal-binding protein